jgi:endonuclease YncB( thermonuclease family)
VYVRVVGESYERRVGRMYRQGDDLDVNAELVKQGAAWVSRKYNRDPNLLVLEKEAKSAKRGLWSLPEADQIPPWAWRRLTRP